MVASVSDVTAANGEKPVLSYVKRGIRKVSKKNQLVKSSATAGQRLVLRVPVDREQQGQSEALEPQGQAEAHSVSYLSPSLQGDPLLRGLPTTFPPM